MASQIRRWAAMPLFFAFATQGYAALTYKGCFSSSTPLSQADTYQYQSTGHCSSLCLPNSAVMGLTAGNGCWCGSQLPAASSQVDDSMCNAPCTGYGSVDCGGTNYWSVYLTGLSNDVSNVGGSSASSSSSASPTTSSSTVAPTTVTSVASANTVLVTVSASATATSTSAPSSGSGTSVAGIAAGVVVGIIALAAIIGGIFFFLRHRRRQQAEENHKRSVQVQDFMRGANERKAPNTAYSQMSDSRLDPEAGRRNSVGSMADEHDYSRRILRVANPDSS